MQLLCTNTQILLFSEPPNGNDSNSEDVGRSEVLENIKRDLREVSRWLEYEKRDRNDSVSNT